MPLYEVAILELPTKAEAEEGKVEKLVFGPEPVVANDPQNAGIVATQGKSLSIDWNRAKVLIRPFE